MGVRGVDYDNVYAVSRGGSHQKRWLLAEMEFLNKPQETTTKLSTSIQAQTEIPTEVPTTDSAKLIHLFPDEVPHDLLPNVHSNALLMMSNVTVESLYKKTRRALSKAISQDGTQDSRFQKPRTKTTEQRQRKPLQKLTQKPQTKTANEAEAPETETETQEPKTEAIATGTATTIRTILDPCARRELRWRRRFKRFDNRDAQTFLLATMKKTWFNPYEAIRKYLDSVNNTTANNGGNDTSVTDHILTSTLSSQENNVRYDTFTNAVKVVNPRNLQTNVIKTASELRFNSMTTAERSLQQSKIGRSRTRFNPIELRYDTLTNAEKAEKKRLRDLKSNPQHRTQRTKCPKHCGCGIDKKCYRKCQQKHQPTKRGSSGQNLVRCVRRDESGARYPRDPNHPKIFNARRIEPDAEPDEPDSEIEYFATDSPTTTYSLSNLDDTLARVSMFVIVFVGLIFTGGALYGIYRCYKTEGIRFVETRRIENMVTLPVVARPAPLTSRPIPVVSPVPPPLPDSLDIKI